MKRSEIKTGRAVHISGMYRIDMRPATDESWRFQCKKLLDPTEGPEWVPVPEEHTNNWPLDGWNSIDDW